MVKIVIKLLKAQDENQFLHNTQLNNSPMVRCNFMNNEDTFICSLKIQVCPLAYSCKGTH